MTNMDFKKTSIKLIQVSLFIVLISMFNTAQTWAETNQFNSTNGIDCTTIIKPEVKTLSDSIDSAKAKSMAENNAAFKTKVNGYLHTFNSMFNTWSIDKTNCNIELKSVNMVYSLNDTHGYVKNVVVTEDPSLTTVVNVSEHVGLQYSVAHWSGYEFAADGNNPHTTAVYEATASYNVPAVSQPSSPTNACRTDLGNKKCDLSIWAGLEDTSQASDNNLAQTGTDGTVNCNSSCTSSYIMWYQFVGSNAVQCTGLTVSSGDSITADVYSEVTYGGSSTSYDISLTNNSQSELCTVTGHSYFTSSTPKDGDFINEIACLSSCGTGSATYETLAKFGSDTMTGSTYYSGGTHSISFPYGNNWWIKDLMNNGASPPNITVGSASTGSFTETWQNSGGT